MTPSDEGLTDLSNAISFFSNLIPHNSNVVRVDMQKAVQGAAVIAIEAPLTGNPEDHAPTPAPALVRPY